MDRTERLLDLVALLLDSSEPVSWHELRESFPEDYGRGSVDAAERKFERDKAELLELGIPVEYVQGEDDRRDGYVVNRERYYLPEVGLTPDELAVLYAAGSAALASNAFPAAPDLAHALRKIGFFAEGNVSAPPMRMEMGPVSGPALGSNLEVLWEAVRSRKWVQMTYYSPRGNEVTSRKVDPYALAFRQGIWSLVGFCHLRQGLRTFHVHRIREVVANTAKPRSADFEVPSDFKLDDFVATHPWQHRIHAPVEVTLALSADLWAQRESLFPGAVEDASHQTLRVTATFTEGLLRHVMTQGSGCRVESPPSVVDEWKTIARRIEEAHR